jgi:hypothetical protein
LFKKSNRGEKPGKTLPKDAAKDDKKEARSKKPESIAPKSESIDEREMKPDIDTRIKELEEEGKTKEQIVLILYEEGYSTTEIMKRHLPLKSLASQKERSEETDMGLVAGPTKGTGALQEFKEMFRAQIAKTREFQEAFYSLGMGTLFASLSKAGLSVDDFRQIAHDDNKMREAFKKAGDTVYKALEYFHSDLITHVEEERDEARSYAALLDSRIAQLKRDLEPKMRMEKMIYNMVLLSGSVKIDPDALGKLLETYLELQVMAA